MIVPCEIAVKSVVPAVKAIIAKELVEKHDMKQDKVAELLGISQSAVSKYTRNVRGYVIKIDEIEELEPMIERMISLLMNETCERINVLEVFCQMCAIVRKTSLMCQFCQQADPTIRLGKCSFCRSPNLNLK